MRWAATEAVARYHGGAPIRPAYQRIADRRGKMIARVRRGQEAADAGLLRATRRRDPLSGPPGGQLMRFGHSQDAARVSTWPPTPVGVAGVTQPAALTVAGNTPCARQRNEGMSVPPNQGGL